MTFVLPVTWWFLIAAAIHAEPLSGTGHFWLTRPYSKKSLVAAKVLFVLTFVNAPLLIADLAIVHAAGFPIGVNISGLMWTQVLLLAAFELPAAAVSSITGGLLEFLVVSLVLILMALAWILVAPMTQWGSDGTAVGWVKDYCLYAQAAAVAAIVLICQYARRATASTRILAMCTPLLLLASSVLLPWSAAFALQTHLSKQCIDLSSLHIQLDSERKWSGSVYVNEQDDVVADIPIKADGLPVGIELAPNGVTIKLRTSNGETQTLKETPPHSFDSDSGTMSLRATMTKPFYERVKNEPLRFYGTLYASLYGKKQSVSLPLNSAAVYVDGVGICAAGERFLLCNSPFRAQRSVVDIRVTQPLANGREEQLAGVVSHSPFPADFNIDPLFRLFSPRLQAISAALIETSEPIAFVEKKFEISQVILRDFKFRH